MWGVIPDAQGSWISGFAKFTRKCSVLSAELWGIFVGLKLTIEHGFSKVEVNSDSRVVVEVLSKVRKKTYGFSNLKQQIIHLLSVIRDMEISFAYRVTNACTNSLSLHGRMLKNDIQIFHEAPDFLMKSLKMDIDDVLVSRLLVV